MTALLLGCNGARGSELDALTTVVCGAGASIDALSVVGIVRIRRTRGCVVLAIVVLRVVVADVVVVVVFSSSGATYHSFTTCNAITMHCYSKYARYKQRRRSAGVVWQSRALECNDQYNKNWSIGA